ncbi:glycosyltransferase family 39 protein [Parafrankia sp. EAN1pec]|uniref:glycosyltransferase family 39 protein n=1 Tax=Parafrankia sp. (strain EAN1pec) TaxID=298653 RepID=UPI0026BF4272
MGSVRMVSADDLPTGQVTGTTAEPAAAEPAAAAVAPRPRSAQVPPNDHAVLTGRPPRTELPAETQPDAETQADAQTMTAAETEPSAEAPPAAEAEPGEQTVPAQRTDYPSRAEPARLIARFRRARDWTVAASYQFFLAGTLLAVTVGAVLRFATPSHLWLDESLTVGIASRPVPDLLQALRHDGSPPLYYLLLHLWISVFGDGDIAVRALSGVLSLATLPLAWLAGRYVGRAATALGNGGPSAEQRVGLAALLLFACSPYAIRYGSETRMYSLVVLLVLVFGFAAVRALNRPDLPRLAALTLATAALVYTHYWTFLVVFTVAAFLLLQARRREHYRRPALRAFVAMAASAVLFAPWMPVFLFQMLHTGTPWAPRVQAQVLLDTVFDWAGPQSTGALLGIILLGGALIGLTARPLGGELHVKISGRAPGRYLAAIWLAPLVLAYFVNMFGGSAYAERYTGIALPACLLLAALGIAQLPVHRAFVAVVVVASISGLLGGYQLARTERTQAGEIANRIADLARPGDVVAYCPDQLGPAVHRAIQRRGGIDVREIVYADEAGPALVDWVDYADRMKRANGAAFAAEVNDLAGPDHAVLLVRADGYRFLEGACAVLSDQLASLRDRALQVEKRDLYEGASLERFSTLR